MFRSISVLWIVILAAILAFTFTRGSQAIKVFVAVIAVVLVGVMAWNIAVSLRR